MGIFESNLVHFVFYFLKMVTVKILDVDPTNGIACGLEKGRKLPKANVPKRCRGARQYKKMKGSKKKVLINEVIRATVGYAPYEKRMMELIRQERPKRALRFAKKRLGSLTRAKKKREEVLGALAHAAKK